MCLWRFNICGFVEFLSLWSFNYICGFMEFSSRFVGLWSLSSRLVELLESCVHL